MVESSFTSPDMGGAGIHDRRSSPRLPLLLPARLICVFDTFNCVLVDFSGTGALVKMERTLSVGAGAYLCAGDFRIFSVTVRAVANSEASSLTGLTFDTRLTREQILDLRTFASNLNHIEHYKTYSAARDWSKGGSR